jgi:hypothetical protein
MDEKQSITPPKEQKSKRAKEQKQDGIGGVSEDRMMGNII